MEKIMTSWNAEQVNPKGGVDVDNPDQVVLAIYGKK
jgi:hypothetical protein